LRPRRPPLAGQAWRLRRRPGAAPRVRWTAPSAGPETLETLCPTGAISVTGGVAGDTVRVDQGKCILCGRCVAERPGVFTWSQGATGPGAAAVTRDQFILPELPETDQAVQAARARLRERTAALRRSVHIRHVTPVPTAVKSGRSRRCSARSTTSTGPACSSPRARATPMSCSSPEREPAA